MEKLLNNNIGQSTFIDLYPSFSRVLVGIVILFEIIFLFYIPPSQYENFIIHDLILLNIPLQSVFLLVITAYIIGTLNLWLFNFMFEFIFFLGRMWEKINKTKKWNLMYKLLLLMLPQNPFEEIRIKASTHKIIEESPAYKHMQKITKKIDEYFNSSDFDDWQRLRLCDLYCTKHSSLFKTHLISFQNGLVRGFYSNFFLLFLFFLVERNIFMTIVILILLINVGVVYKYTGTDGYLDTFEATYMKVMLEDKDNSHKTETN
jgi:hypothetical protein